MIAIQDVSKAYATPAGPYAALRGVTLDVARGEFAAIVGKSGSGKSTLLNMIAGIDTPSSGAVIVDGTPIQTLTTDGLASWRGRTVGVVFQFFQLLPTLTVIENVMLPMDFCRAVPARDRAPRAMALLDRVGVADQARKLPSALSGGQQQRVAIARALANDPPVLLADEPTGNLDTATSADIFQLFVQLAGEGKTVVVVTHEPGASALAGRTITMADGRVS